MKTNRPALPTDFVSQALNAMQPAPSLSQDKKEEMLRRVLQTSARAPALARLGRWVADCPWRLAFGLAAVQSVACTLLFGTQYTNFILSFFRG